MTRILALLLTLTGLACGEYPQPRPGRPQPRDPVAGLPEGDRQWYWAWRWATGETSLAALRERTRLAIVWLSDRGMALRLSMVVLAKDVDVSFRQAADTLLKKDPKDPSVWYARGVWSMGVERNVAEAVTAGCHAVELAPNVSAYHEICGDAQVASGDARGGTAHLATAYGLAVGRPDQCRLVTKLQAVAPDPDAALASVSPHILAHCEHARQERAAQSQLEEQRRMQRASCLASCLSGMSACQSSTRPLNCPGLYDGCVSSCQSGGGSP